MKLLRYLLRDNSAVGSSHETDAQAPFGSRNQAHRFLSRQVGKIRHLQIAVLAESHAIVANHGIPIGIARRRNNHSIERTVGLRHSSGSFQGSTKFRRTLSRTWGEALCLNADLDHQPDAHVPALSLLFVIYRT